MVKRSRPLLFLLLICVLVGAVGAPVGTTVTAQGDDDLAVVVAQLTDEIALLRADVTRLQADVAALQTEAPAPDGGAPGATMPNAWTPREASARATGDCDPAIGCGYRYSDWSNLTFNPDGSYTWEGPYASGTFEMFPRGTDGGFDVVLTGTGDNRCTATYYPSEAFFEIRLDTCPGFMIENQYDPGVMQELDSGDILFQPLR